MSLSLPLDWSNILDTTTLSDIEKKIVTYDAVYPSCDDVFKAFELCSFESTRVVILGQDPYHGPGQAMGMSFSVPCGVPVPPSLANIYKEIQSDLGRPSICAPDGDLTQWARQGVLLLNSVLTVQPGKPTSHAGIGWERITDSVIEKISRKKDNVVFILWGTHAQKKKALIDEKKHLILQSSHPSPLSSYRGFLGCKHFSMANDYLKNKGHEIIEW